MPPVEAIRAQLVGEEFAGFRRTKQGTPYIEARTEQGNSALAYVEDDLYALETAGNKVACDPITVPGAISGAISRILDSARRAPATTHQ